MLEVTIARMKNQQIILLGIGIWLTGVVLDGLTTRYAFLLIHIGTLTTIYGCLKWLRVKENRTLLKGYLKPKSGFIEMVKQAFDFSWSRVSIIWTICALGGMLIVHLGALTLGNSGAYEQAIQSIHNDAHIKEEAGEILQFSYMVTGNTTNRGRSNLNIGIVGSKRNLRVNAVVDGSNGNYETKKLEIQN